MAKKYYYRVSHTSIYSLYDKFEDLKKENNSQQKEIKALKDTQQKANNAQQKEIKALKEEINSLKEAFKSM